METNFASPGRQEKKEVQRQADLITSKSYALKILDSYQDMIVVVNKDRQVVFANKMFLSMIGVQDFEEALGNRPGELINCIHAFTNEAGCGTATECRYCGAVLTVLESQKTAQRMQGEARITVTAEGKIIPLDLRVIATPFSVDNEDFTIAVLVDISKEKQKERLEKAFFHDIINTTGALSNSLELFPKKGLDETQATKLKSIRGIIETIMAEIQGQRDLLKIENKEVEPIFKEENTAKMLEDTISVIIHHQVAQNKTLIVDTDIISQPHKTDRRLLQRVLFNLIKNALEASKDNETVRVGCKMEKNKILYWINNKGMMSEEVQSQIFQRSFSTKGPGRGIGTFSAKILVEEYLGGKIFFESTEKEGTTFFVVFDSP